MAQNAHLRFFFATAVQRISSTFDVVARNFPNLFGRAAKPNHQNDRRNVKSLIARRIQEIQRRGIEIAESSPNRNMVEHFGILKFCELLSKIIKEQEQVRK